MKLERTGFEAVLELEIIVTLCAAKSTNKQYRTIYLFYAC